jgi:hypothetical protein
MESIYIENGYICKGNSWCFTAKDAKGAKGSQKLTAECVEKRRRRNQTPFSTTEVTEEHEGNQNRNKEFFGVLRLVVRIYV